MGLWQATWDRLIPVDEQSKCGGLNAPKRERSIAVIAATNVVVARPVHTVRPIHRGSNARGNIKRFFVLIVDQLMNGFAEVAFVQRARPKTQAGAPPSGIVENRSEEHTRVGNECVSTVNFCVSPYH